MPSTTTSTVPGGVPPRVEPGARTSELAVSAGARWVSPTGVDSPTCGATKATACATVQAAYSLVASGGTVVLAGGEYRGAGNVGWRLPKASVTIMAEPGTRPRVLGTTRIDPSGWTDSGVRNADGAIVWTRSGLATYGTGAPDWGTGAPGPFADVGHPAWVDPATPAAGEVEQLVVDGVEATQAPRSTPFGSLATGSFVVDRGDGSNAVVALAAHASPARSTVEWASHRRAFRITGSGAGTRIIGITFDRFASNNRDPDAQGAHSAASIEHASGAALTDVEILNSSGRGLYLGGNRPNAANASFDQPLRDVRLERVTVAGSGATGIDSFLTQGLSISGSVIDGSNRSGYNWATTGPMSIHAGIKATWSTGLSITDSAVSNNRAHGIWFDLYCGLLTVQNNEITSNSGSGAFIEISSDAAVVGNRIENNGVVVPAGAPHRSGVVVGGSRDVTLTNNTFANSFNSHVLVYDDDETHSPGRSTAVAAGFPWDPSVRLSSNSFNGAGATISTGSPHWVEDITEPGP